MCRTFQSSIVTLNGSTQQIKVSTAEIETHQLVYLGKEFTCGGRYIRTCSEESVIYLRCTRHNPSFDKLLDTEKHCLSVFLF